MNNEASFGLEPCATNITTEWSLFSLRVVSSHMHSVTILVFEVTTTHITHNLRYLQSNPWYVILIIYLRTQCL